MDSFLGCTGLALDSPLPSPGALRVHATLKQHPLPVAATTFALPAPDPMFARRAASDVPYLFLMATDKASN